MVFEQFVCFPLQEKSQVAQATLVFKSSFSSNTGYKTSYSEKQEQQRWSRQKDGGREQLNSAMPTRHKHEGSYHKTFWYAPFRKSVFLQKLMMIAFLVF